MKSTTYIKYLRVSPKKMRELAGALKGLTPVQALDRLLLISGKAGQILAKCIKSAQANAVNGLKMSQDKLRISSIEVGKGPFFKRWNPVSRGMAHQIKKRTSHIKVTVEEIASTKLVSAEKKEVKKEVKSERSKRGS